MLTWEVALASCMAAAYVIDKYGLQDEPPCVKQYILAGAFVRASLALSLLLRGRL